VITVDVGNAKYLVSTRGESQWVKNVRANPNVTISTKSGTTDYLAEEVPEQDRQPILTAYREKAGKMVDGYFRRLPLEADHPVFALTNTG
jgi:deazaflavin-dependent oxidoreductase (nitroreductase family)